MSHADPYYDAIEDPDNRRMRTASGAVDDARPLVALLYELARDDLPVGVFEDKIDRLVNRQGLEFQFTNGWLARWAQDAADRLTE